MIMSVEHLVGRRRVLLALAIGMLGAATGCGEGGGSAGDATKGEDYKQKKLDSMKDFKQKKQGASRKQ
jgi:hypothetical protein